MQFQKHAERANVACEGLVVEGFGFFAFRFFCYFGEFVDDFPFCFYEVFGVAALLRFFVYTPFIYRVNWRFGHLFTLPSSAKLGCPLLYLLSL